MIAVLVVISVVALAALLIAGGTWWWARRITERMRRQDTELRSIEAETGRCAACDGAGTRIEGLPGVPQATQGQVQCYRCGGTGLPPPPGRVPDLAPTALGLTLRQLRHRG